MVAPAGQLKGGNKAAIRAANRIRSNPPDEAGDAYRESGNAVEEIPAGEEPAKHLVVECVSYRRRL